MLTKSKQKNTLSFRHLPPLPVYIQTAPMLTKYSHYICTYSLYKAPQCVRNSSLTKPTIFVFSIITTFLEHVHGCAESMCAGCTYLCMCEGQRTPLCSYISPSGWVLETELRAPSFEASTPLVRPSHKPPYLQSQAVYLIKLVTYPGYS